MSDYVKCPDCDGYDTSFRLIGEQGDGVCGTCHGSGTKHNLGSAIAGDINDMIGIESEDPECEDCGGDGICSTCGGDGFA